MRPGPRAVDLGLRFRRVIVFATIFPPSRFGPVQSITYHKPTREERPRLAEESSRGRRQPKKLMTVQRKRRIQRAAAKLADSNCTKDEFLEVIRELGYEERSKEFEACVKLWNSRRGRS